MNNIKWKLQPAEIERLSFEIIDKEAPEHNWPSREWNIIRRLIHTSADFEYAEKTFISTGAVEKAIEAIKSGAPIITDTKMALSGISQAKLKAYSNKVLCLISEDETVELAKKQGYTRAMAAVDLALEKYFNNGNSIWVIGNAPTALYRLMERLKSDKLPSPALIVGLPVGFVNAKESKEELIASPYFHIANKSRKGGSNVAAAVINALAVLANE